MWVRESRPYLQVSWGLGLCALGIWSARPRLLLCGENGESQGVSALFQHFLTAVYVKY